MFVIYMLTHRLHCSFGRVPKVSVPPSFSYLRTFTVRRKCISGDYLRTNVMADYLDKLSTDVNYITYIEETDEDVCYLQVIIVIGIIIYMFFSDYTKEK